jgi:hypothetical protein
MTKNAQFCCILRGKNRFCDTNRPSAAGLKQAREAVTGSYYRAHQAAGALRETTQARSHDPTAQPHR